MRYFLYYSPKFSVCADTRLIFARFTRPKLGFARNVATKEIHSHGETTPFEPMDGDKSSPAFNCDKEWGACMGSPTGIFFLFN